MADTSSGSWLTDRVRKALEVRLTERPPIDEDRRKGIVITFCILASVLLWFSFSMNETYVRVVEIPLEVVNLSDSEALVNEPPSSARVTVEGEGIQLLRLYYNPPSIPLDAGEESLDLATAAPEVITNVRLDAIIPRAVALVKEAKVSRRIPIVSRVGVSAPPGHHIVGTPALDPDSVTVTGATSIVSNLTAWPTEARQVIPVGDTLSVTVPLSDSLSGLVTFDASSVVYRTSLREFTEGVRTVDIRVIGAPAGQAVQFEPPTIQVVYQVALDQYDAALDAQDFYTEVAYQAIRSDTTGSVVPMVHYPEGIEFREYRLVPPALGYYFQVLFD